MFTLVCILFVNIKNAKTGVQLNSGHSGLSPDFSVQLYVSLSERLNQKVKSPDVASKVAGCSTDAVQLQQNFCHRSCCMFLEQCLFWC